MRHLVYTEAGHNHQNEDCVEVRSHPDNPAVLLCALADGQGGRSGGAEASQIAVTKCLEIASSYPVKRLMQIQSWYPILSGVDQAVRDDTEAGLTTLIGLCVTEDMVCGASCGDSAAHLLGSGGNVLLTENQRKNPPVGSGAACPVAFRSKFRSDGKLLVVSDGVWRYLGDDAIGEVGAREQGQELIAELRRMQADQNRGQLPDDFSIILVQKS